MCSRSISRKSLSLSAGQSQPTMAAVKSPATTSSLSHETHFSGPKRTRSLVSTENSESLVSIRESSTSSASAHRTRLANLDSRDRLKTSAAETQLIHQLRSKSLPSPSLLFQSDGRSQPTMVALNSLATMLKNLTPRMADLFDAISATFPSVTTKSTALKKATKLSSESSLRTLLILSPGHLIPLLLLSAKILTNHPISNCYQG